MKKTYMQPQVAVVKIAQVLPIANSLKLDSTKTLDEESDFLTKEEEEWELWDE